MAATVALIGTANGQSIGLGPSAYHTLGVKANGTIAGWGYNNQGQAANTGTFSNIVGVAAGYEHSLVLRSDGSVTGFGNNSFFQVSDGIVVGSPGSATAISAGWYHSLALRTNGTVAAWGRNNELQVSGAASVTNAIAIAAGGKHSLALRSNGTIAAWGANDFNQSSGPAAASNVQAIAAGWEHSLALNANGTVSAWGRNNFGQSFVPGSVTGAVSVSAGEFHSLALRSNGTVVAWGADNQYQASGANGLSNIVYAAAGAYHNYAVQSNGAILSWGSVANGQRNTPGGFALPTMVTWNSAANGDYLNSHRWNGRIPSTALSTAVFNKNGSYSIGFGNTARAAALNISAGNVTFNLGTHQYQVGGNVQVSGGATFNQNGTLVASGSVTNAGTYALANNSSLTATNVFNSGLLINNGTVNAQVSGNGVVQGTGHFGSLIRVGSGGTLAPGNSVGLMTGTNAEFDEGGSFEFEIGSALGAMGAEWDGLQLSGLLDITATSTNPFEIKLNSMGNLVTGFDATSDYQWTFLTAAGGIENFSEDKFSIDSTDFLNDLAGGAFSVTQDGNSLVLGFSAVPEPSAMLLVGSILLAVGARRQRTARVFDPL